MLDNALGVLGIIMNSSPDPPRYPWEPPVTHTTQPDLFGDAGETTVQTAGLFAEVVFDRPLEAEHLQNLAGKVAIEYGRYVSAGDPFEKHRPGYQVVQDQMRALAKEGVRGFRIFLACLALGVQRNCKVFTSEKRATRRSTGSAG